MTKYTFTFEPAAERKFREVVRPVDHKEDADLRYVDRQMIAEMDPEAALTFRLGMKEVKIRRERTEEELAEEKELDDRNTIRINVQVPMGPQTP